MKPSKPLMPTKATRLFEARSTQGSTLSGAGRLVHRMATGLQTEKTGHEGSHRRPRPLVHGLRQSSQGQVQRRSTVQRSIRSMGKKRG